MSKAKFFGVGDVEILSHSLDEAVYEYIDDCIAQGETPAEEVKVQGFVRKQLTPDDEIFRNRLDSLIEDIDIEYSNMDSDDSYALSDELKEAYKAFCERFCSEYPVEQCKAVGKPVTVKTVDYLDLVTKAELND